MRKNPWTMLLVVGFIFVAIATFIGAMAMLMGPSNPERSMMNNSLLVMEINGPIFESHKFLKKFYKHAESNKVKGILLRVDSPGGAVGPSEEIYTSLLKFKQKTKKPIVVYAPSLAASGAYYISMAADQIYTMRGSLLGSIGVIMSFANLEGLYSWAKVSRYSITSGKLKDAGAEYRAMTDEEKGYFQELIDETYNQFLGTVAQGRKMKLEEVQPWADGRVFNGAKAVEVGLADAIGTEVEALDKLGELAGLGSDYEVYEPPKIKPSLLEKLLMDSEEDEESISNQVTQAIDQIFQRQLIGKPLFILPSYLNGIR